MVFSLCAKQHVGIYFQGLFLCFWPFLSSLSDCYSNTCTCGGSVIMRSICSLWCHDQVFPIAILYREHAGSWLLMSHVHCVRSEIQFSSLKVALVVIYSNAPVAWTEDKRAMCRKILHILFTKYALIAVRPSFWFIMLVRQRVGKYGIHFMPFPIPPLSRSSQCPLVPILL